MMSQHVWTIGHSTHPLQRFLALLARHEIEALVDIRRFPVSRKFPHFSRENLAAALRSSRVQYHWLEALGGRRSKEPGERTSTNLGLESEGFRNFADYMLTSQFRQGAQELLQVAGQSRTVIMCAEALFWRCHRRLASDFLVTQGVTVEHIMPTGELRPHKLTKGAQIEGGTVAYPRAKPLLGLDIDH